MKKRAIKKPTPKKPITFDGVVLDRRETGVGTRYTGLSPLGHVVVRTCQIPEGFITFPKIATTYRDAWECVLGGAIIARALRPGECAKRGERWLAKILAVVIGASKEEMQKLASDIAENRREARAISESLVELRKRTEGKPTIAELRQRGVHVAKQLPPQLDERQILALHADVIGAMPTVLLEEPPEMAKRLGKSTMIDFDARERYSRPLRVRPDEAVYLASSEVEVLERARAVPPGSPPHEVADILTALLVFTVTGAKLPMLVVPNMRGAEAARKYLEHIRKTWIVPAYLTIVTERTKSKVDNRRPDVVVHWIGWNG